MTAGKARRESPAHLEKTTFDGGRRERDGHGVHPDRERCGGSFAVAPLLEQVDAGIGGITADGAYDGAATYDAVAARAGDIPVIISPHMTAAPGTAADHHLSQRDRHIAVMVAKGRLSWQEETSYGRRSLVETAMGCCKTIIAPGLHARSMPGQRAEAAVGVAVLNRMLHAGRPNSVRSPRMVS